MFEPFLNLNGIRVACGEESLVVDNLGVSGTVAITEAGDLLSRYFEKIIPLRGYLDTEKFLQKTGKIALKGGVVLNTAGILIRKEGR